MASNPHQSEGLDWIAVVLYSSDVRDFGLSRCLELDLKLEGEYPWLEKLTSSMTW